MSMITSLVFDWDDDELRFVLDQHTELDIYSASLLKQQYSGRHVASLGHIILIQSQPVFTLSPKCCMLSGDQLHSLCMLTITPPMLWSCKNIFVFVGLVTWLFVCFVLLCFVFIIFVIFFRVGVFWLCLYFSFRMIRFTYLFHTYLSKIEQKKMTLKITCSYS
jgi:hypothetical protein